MQRPWNFLHRTISMHIYPANKRLKAMSFIEMMVAIFIMGVGMIGFSQLLLSTWKSNKFILETGNTAVQVNRASNEIISNLRRVRQADNGDYPIEYGSNFDLKIYLDVDGDGTTERVHYWLDSAAQEVKRGVTEPTTTTPPTYPGSDTTVTTIATYIVNTNVQPVFYYYNQNYPGDTINNPLTTPVNIHNVRLIRVLLRMNIDPIRAPNNINVESFADLRNLENYDN